MQYIVHHGDTLESIAWCSGTSVDEILQANPGILIMGPLYAGQEIVLPGSEYHLRPACGGGRFMPGVTEPRVAGLTSGGGSWFATIRERVSQVVSDMVSAATGEPPWMETARSEIGVAEYAGMHSANPRIMEYFRASRYWGEDDTSAINAWCGSFVAWVMKQNDIAPVAKAFRAKAWLNFGTEVDQPIPGAIGIKSRVGGGHVSFVVGKSEDGTKLYMLGGNQDDKVQISEYPRDVWTKFVVPPGYDASGKVLPVYTAEAARAGGES